MVLRGVGHHFDDAFGSPVGRRDCRPGQAKAARQRRSHAVSIEELAFDFRVLYDVFRERVELRFELQIKAEACHDSEQPTLLGLRDRERLKQPPVVPGQVGPALLFPDIHILLI